MLAADPAEVEQNVEDLLSELLGRFPKYVENGWIQSSGGVGYFGDGGNEENGIRTNSSVLYTLALLSSFASHFQLEPEEARELKTKARCLLAYLTNSHATGSGTCANGKKWGLEWQSSWWAAKLAFGAQLIWGDLSEQERDSVHNLVVAEAGRQLSRVAPTGLYFDTKAEENAWDCEILACAVAMLPNHPLRSAWNNKLIEFSANVFSSPHDRVDRTMIDGRAVCDLVYTCNVHGDYSIENHGSFHFCYVASPILSKAWCVYALSSANCSVPESIYHNLSRVWSLAEKTFLGNRFAYIGGQDWARYVYGEYFIVPSLVFLSNLSSDGREQKMLLARLRTLAFEARTNEDGSFFGQRFTASKFGGQHGKYETDCFCCLALAWALRRTKKIAKPRDNPLSTTGVFKHVSPEGQFCFVRGNDYFFSFSWTTLTQDIPNISFINLKDDSLGEWQSGNLLGRIQVLRSFTTVGVRAMKFDEESLTIEGVCLRRDRRGRPLIEHFVKVTLDTQKGILCIHSKYVARSRIWLARVTGLTWSVPNDLFNDYRREISYQGGVLELHQGTTRKGAVSSLVWKVLTRFGIENSCVEMLKSNWINIDNLVGLVSGGGQPISVRRYPTRTSSWKSLFVEQFEAPKRRHRFFVRGGQTLLDSKLLMHLGDAQETKSLAGAAALGNSSAI